MKYYLDTEFIEYPCTIDLVSVALVAEDGRELYCESLVFDQLKASPWVKENVIAKLWSRQPLKSLWRDFWQSGGVGRAAVRSEIRDEILRFVGDDPEPEFWGYYADYDWVVFCWLFGTMMDLPKNFPMFCRDIKQLCVSLGDPNLSQPEDNEHNALADARWNRDMHARLQQHLKVITIELQAVSPPVRDELKTMRDQVVRLDEFVKTTPDFKYSVDFTELRERLESLCQI